MDKNRRMLCDQIEMLWEHKQDRNEKLDLEFVRDHAGAIFQLSAFIMDVEDNLPKPRRPGHV